MDDTSPDLAWGSEAPIEEAPLAEAVPAEMNTASPAVDMTEFTLAEVYGLHYERTEGMDRTAILADDSLQFTTSAPDATPCAFRG